MNEERKSKGLYFLFDEKDLFQCVSIRSEKHLIQSLIQRYIPKNILNLFEENEKDNDDLISIFSRKLNKMGWTVKFYSNEDIKEGKMPEIRV